MRERKIGGGRGVRGKRERESERVKEKVRESKRK